MVYGNISSFPKFRLVSIFEAKYDQSLGAWIVNLNDHIESLNYMSSTQNGTIARNFVEEIFNARNTEAAKNFVTPDIVYHGMGEEVSGIEEFKKWVSEDLRVSRHEDHNIR
jgi:hypothetical protein